MDHIPQSLRRRGFESHRCQKYSKEKHKASQLMYSSDIHYADIFSDNIRKQKEVTELYRQLLETRTQISSSLPVAKTGPVQSNQNSAKPYVFGN